MKSENIIVDKSYDFALKIVKTYEYLTKQKKIDFTLARQLLRSGTSIGANIQESAGSFSKKEFIFKMQIAYKEAKESLYWINLLTDSNLMDKTLAKELKLNCEELLKIITSILKTSKSNE